MDPARADPQRRQNPVLHPAGAREPGARRQPGLAQAGRPGAAAGLEAGRPGQAVHRGAAADRRGRRRVPPLQQGHAEADHLHGPRGPAGAVRGRGVAGRAVRPDQARRRGRRHPAQQRPSAVQSGRHARPAAGHVRANRRSSGPPKFWGSGPRKFWGSGPRKNPGSRPPKNAGGTT
ncbi:hypothetical protein F5972_07980 [Microbispora cellulosiformans]|uniref:Uncharacterized protein n=1 Tax=Microbispora cellulosiformans TaxID=2614688 RepID=A0A5J5K511_9ACTN|nr:hypothetical protein F5972_07980 [Microbispora cellulosiformans]